MPSPLKALRILKPNIDRTFKDVMSRLQARDSSVEMARLKALREQSPDSFHLFSPEALYGMMTQTGNRADAQALTIGSPKSFLDLAASLPSPFDDYSAAKIGALRSLINREQPDWRDMDYLDPRGYYRGIGPYNGLAQEPYLGFGVDGGQFLEVAGHEGRHRSHALEQDFPRVQMPIRLGARGDRSVYDALMERPPRVWSERDVAQGGVRHRALLPTPRLARGGRV